MAIDKSVDARRGESAADLAEYLKDFEAGGYLVGSVVEAVCAGCKGRVFRLRTDVDEGCAERICVACDKTVLMLDSEDYWDDAEPEAVLCACGADQFEVSVGFSLRATGDVRWISIGTRCAADGRLGCCADWKIDYGPSADLLERV